MITLNLWLVCNRCWLVFPVKMGEGISIENSVKQLVEKKTYHTVLHHT